MSFDKLSYHKGDALSLPKGWEIKNLGDVSQIVNGGTPKSKVKEYWDGNINWITPADLGKLNSVLVHETPRKITGLGLQKSSAKLFPENSVILSTRAPIGHLAINTVPMATNQGCRGIVPNENLDPRFLYYFLKGSVQLLNNLGTGATFLELSTKNLSSVKIPLPPLPEQQRIVSILDRAFAAIDKAKANAEQNLKNARELFESYLQGVFEKKGDGWEIRTLGEVSKINYGYTEKASFDEVGPKFLRITDIQENGVDWETVPYCKCSDKDLPKYKLETGDIVFARTGATTGKSYLIDNPPNAVFASYLIRLRMNSINEFIPEFISYFFQTKTYWDKINAGISGSAQGGFNATKLGELEFHFPKSKDEQQTIVRQLDALRAETQKLEALYQQKIDDLEELKKSVLQKAFAGELTLSTSISVPDTKVIPLQKVEGISPTDLQAGITALALQKHIEQNHQHSFHHVKAEKIVHLSEYILNIDLNRNPVKDAAGPNDFQHAKKVESRARKAGFYTVYKNGDYYDYRQGNSFNKVIQKAQNSLGEKADTLSQIIDILAPMSTQQAEIVATIYAAWNNLLLSEIEFTDEDIVTEARENWHKKKLAIERKNFFNALEWMKKHELLIPKGNGKVVETKVREKK